MTRVQFVPALFGLALSGAWPAVAVAAESIGFSYGTAVYRVAGTGVRGNATLLEGDTVEARDGPATVQLKGGTRMWLAPGTRVKVSSDGAVLLSGAGQFQTPPQYVLEARAVRLAAVAPNTVLRVALDDRGGAVVSPLAGAVGVMNSRGVPVGELSGSDVVRFAETEAADGVRLSGCLNAAGGRFTLTDAVTNVTVRLTGAGLERSAGHPVSISGRRITASPGDVTTVAVDHVEQVSSAECSTASDTGNQASTAAGAPNRQRRGSSAPGGASGAGWSVGKKVAIIGGIAATATVAGLAASGVFSGAEPAASR